MKTRYELVTDILNREGGAKYTNNPNDSGGPTKYGITQGALSKWRGKPVTPQDVQNLQETEARAIYERNYIEAPGYGKLTNIALVEQMIDAGVNHGTAGAVKMLQRALGGVVVDGKLGPATAAAANNYPAHKLVVKFLAARARAYAVALKAPKNRVFAAGWFNRLAGVMDDYSEST